MQMAPFLLQSTAISCCILRAPVSCQFYASIVFGNEAERAALMAALACSRMHIRDLHELDMQVLTAAFPKLTTLNLECVHLERNAWALMYLTSLEHLRLRRVILAPLTCSDSVAEPLRSTL